MSLDFVVKTLLEKGVQAEVSDLKAHYRPQRRHIPYTISEITQLPGSYHGRLLVLKNGGALIIEYDSETKRYNAQFRLITPDASELGMKEAREALPSPIDGKKYFAYSYSCTDCSSDKTLVEHIFWDEIFKKRALCQDPVH